ncbi:DUF3795 domain-containing protein [Methanooceanicella nereidis]|nr:DUF3795 domain-containing protein [Methanocella sp. CWC-04]
MSGTNDRSLVGKCGIYCGSCPIYRSYKDRDDKTAFELSFATRCTIDQVRCEGCGSDDRFVLSQGCFYRKCAVEKGLAACAECGDYPCEKLSWFYDDGIAKEKEASNNSNRMRETSIDAWLEEADDRWRCKNCDSPVSIGIKKCHKCGLPVQ